MIFLCIASGLYGNWNNTFDEKTYQLALRASCIDIDEYEVFAHIRETFLRNSHLEKHIADMTALEKEIILRRKEGVVLKIRKSNNINEAFAWEISNFFGGFSCIVPAFPIKIGGKYVIIQKVESFAIAEEKTNLPRKDIMRSVLVEDYWNACFQMYLLGLGDLKGSNIGINKKGKIRFFDVESSFKYQNQPIRSKYSFHAGFAAQSFAWPQFQQPLDKRAVISLQRFIGSLDNLEEDITTYLAYRSFPLDREGFFYRLEKIRNFPLEKGKTFEDFYRFIFPQMSLGLDELCSIISRILQKKVSLGEALFFAHKDLKREKLSSEEKKELRQWLSIYIQ